MAERRRGFEVEGSDEVKRQLRWPLRHDRADYTRIQEAIRQRLSHEPTRKDRNRKPMGVGTTLAAEMGLGADQELWELRVQPYRVYYTVDMDAGRVNLAGLAHKPRETATPLPTE